MTGRNDEPDDGATDSSLGTPHDDAGPDLPPPRPATDFPVVLRHHRDDEDLIEPGDTAPPHPHRRRHRTWPQRAVLAFNLSVASACFISATAIWYFNDQLSKRQLVDISDRLGATTVAPPGEDDVSGGSAVAPTTAVAGTDDSFPVAVDLRAKNFLLTGSDNRSCIDPDSPYAGAFLGEGSDIGERSDTIMMLRVDPETNQAAVLSFPRDLWVKIAGTDRKSRINAAFDTENPRKLMDTVYENFAILTDHYINIDFCAFKGIVDAVDGVAVPFEFAARDKNTGLFIAQPECHVFEGDEALAYVRSRKYQWFDPVKNTWVTDGTSDYGRITRQQDFLKRALQKALDKGARNPIVARRLIDAVKDNVTTDTELSIDVMLELAGAMRSFDPNTVKTFQVEGRGVKKGNASVIEPVLTSDNMEAILAVFRGQARLSDAPTDETVPGDVVTVPPTSTPGSTVAPTTTAGPATTVGIPPTSVVEIADTERGIFPPDDPSCR